MFRQYRVILRELIINILSSYITNTQLFHKLSHSYMFRQYRVILRELIINILSSYITNTQLFHKLSHSYMFLHYSVILRELIINTLSSYITNTQLLHKLSHSYTFRQYRVIFKDHKSIPCQVTSYNFARYWLQAPWERQNSVETCGSVIICEIIVCLLVIVQDNKICTVQRIVINCSCIRRELIIT